MIRHPSDGMDAVVDRLSGQVLSIPVASSGSGLLRIQSHPEPNMYRALLLASSLHGCPCPLCNQSPLKRNLTSPELHPRHVTNTSSYSADPALLAQACKCRRLEDRPEYNWDPRPHSPLNSLQPRGGESRGNSPKSSSPNASPSSRNDCSSSSRKCAGTQTLFSSFVPPMTEGFFLPSPSNSDPSSPSIMDSSLPKYQTPEHQPEGRLVLDLDRRMDRSSSTSHFTPYFSPSGSRSGTMISSRYADETDGNNAPLNLSTSTRGSTGSRTPPSSSPWTNPSERHMDERDIYLSKGARTEFNVAPPAYGQHQIPSVSKSTYSHAEDSSDMDISTNELGANTKVEYPTSKTDNSLGFVFPAGRTDFSNEGLVYGDNELSSNHRNVNDKMDVPSSSLFGTHRNLPAVASKPGYVSFMNWRSNESGSNNNNILSSSLSFRGHDINYTNINNIKDRSPERYFGDRYVHRSDRNAAHLARLDSRLEAGRSLSFDLGMQRDILNAGRAAASPDIGLHRTALIRSRNIACGYDPVVNVGSTNSAGFRNVFSSSFNAPSRRTSDVFNGAGKLTGSNGGGRNSGRIWSPAEESVMAAKRKEQEEEANQSSRKPAGSVVTLMECDEEGVEEHFQRSLGKDYTRCLNGRSPTSYNEKQRHDVMMTSSATRPSPETLVSSASTSPSMKINLADAESSKTEPLVAVNSTVTGAVDDHFAKSLGVAEWTKIKYRRGDATSPLKLEPASRIDSSTNDIADAKLRSSGNGARIDPVQSSGSVDDHFAKALGGDMWQRIKSADAKRASDWGE